jgi:hypothetical protein
MSNAMANLIKQIADIGTKVENTYIFANDSLITDMSANPFIASHSAIVASHFTEDSTSPRMLNFSLNMNSATISLTFDEVVRASSINVSNFVLVSNQSSPNQYDLASPGIDNSVETVIHISIVNELLNRLKKDRQIAVSTETTSLFFADGAIFDTNQNPLLGVEFSNALLCSNFVPDTTSPELISFDIDLNEGTIHLHFDEVINAQSTDFSKITLSSN